MFKKVCTIFEVPFNCYLYGCAYYKRSQIINEVLQKSHIVFYEQIAQPLEIPHRVELLLKICKLAKRYPHMEFLIQSRDEVYGT